MPELTKRHTVVGAQDGQREHALKLPFSMRNEVPSWAEPDPLQGFRLRWLSPSRSYEGGNRKGKVGSYATLLRSRKVRAFNHTFCGFV